MKTDICQDGCLADFFKQGVAIQLWKKMLLEKLIEMTCDDRLRKNTFPVVEPPIPPWPDSIGSEL